MLFPWLSKGIPIIIINRLNNQISLSKMQTMYQQQPMIPYFIGADGQAYYYPTQMMVPPSPYWVMTAAQPQQMAVPVPAKMDLKEDEWTGLYIPVIPSDMALNGTAFDARRDLQDFIEAKMQIGKVRRIDFVDRDDLPNYDETENPVLAAFIHMEAWYDNYNAHMLRNAINEKGEVRQRGYHDGKQMIRFLNTGADNNVNAFRYFVFKINHKPIPDADGKLNIHQLAALKTKHEAELAEAYDEIERLKEELARLKPEVMVSPETNVVDSNVFYDIFSKSSFM